MIRILPTLAAALAAYAPFSQEIAVNSVQRGSENTPKSAEAPAAAHGRRILSTAFVRLGPGEHLAVDLRDGRALLLRDVVMRRKDYCGVLVSGGQAGARYCGGYAEVAAARAGQAPAHGAPDLGGPNPVKGGPAGSG